jgi:hypothetical protein
MEILRKSPKRLMNEQIKELNYSVDIYLPREPCVLTASTMQTASNITGPIKKF